MYKLQESASVYDVKTEVVPVGSLFDALVSYFVKHLSSYLLNLCP